MDDQNELNLPENIDFNGINEIIGRRPRRGRPPRPDGEVRKCGVTVRLMPEMKILIEGFAELYSEPMRLSGSAASFIMACIIWGNQELQDMRRKELDTSRTCGYFYTPIAFDTKRLNQIVQRKVEEAKAKPPTNKNTSTVLLRFTLTEKEVLDESAKSMGKSTAKYILDAITDYIYFLNQQSHDYLMRTEPHDGQSGEETGGQ